MNDFLFVKDKSDYVQIFFSEILYIESKDKYANLVTAKKRYLVPLTLNNMEKLLFNKLFCRVHRSYIISLYHTQRFNHFYASVGDKKIPISRQYRGALQERVIVLTNELKRSADFDNDDLLTIFKNIKPN